MYYYSLRLYADVANRKKYPRGAWQITKGVPGRIVWSRAVVEGDEKACGEYDIPPDMRAEYERLTGLPEFGPRQPPEESTPGIVEMIDDDDDSGFNQPCAFGYLVANHSVYCHNDAWLYAPRKCRRTWYTGGKTRDEDCPGFMARNRDSSGTG